MYKRWCGNSRHARCYSTDATVTTRNSDYIPPGLGNKKQRCAFNALVAAGLNTGGAGATYIVAETRLSAHSTGRHGGGHRIRRGGTAATRKDGIGARHEERVGDGGIVSVLCWRTEGLELRCRPIAFNRPTFHCACNCLAQQLTCPQAASFVQLRTSHNKKTVKPQPPCLSMGPCYPGAPRQIQNMCTTQPHVVRCCTLWPCSNRRGKTKIKLSRIAPRPP